MVHEDYRCFWREFFHFEKIMTTERSGFTTAGRKTQLESFVLHRTKLQMILTCFKDESYRPERSFLSG